MATNSLPSIDASGDETEAMIRAANTSHKKRENLTESSNKDRKSKQLEDPIYTNICTSNCGIAASPHMIRCDTCNRYTHFHCTKLPGYQLQQLMTKGYRKYLCPPCFGNVEPIYDTPYSVQTSEAEIQTEMMKILKEVDIQTEPSENTAKNPDGGTITVYAMAMAEEEIQQLKNEKESMIEELTSLKAENKHVKERLVIEKKNNELLTISLDSVKAENISLVKSSGHDDLTRNDKLSKIITENQIEIERVNDEYTRVSDSLTAKKNDIIVLNQNINALKVECASFTKRLNDSESEKIILERKVATQGGMIRKMNHKVTTEDVHTNGDLLEMERKLSEAKKHLDEEKKKSTDLLHEIQIRKTHEEELENLLSTKEREIIELNETFNEAGNPNFDHVKNIESCMKNHMTQMSKSFSESVTKLLDDKLGEITVKNPSELTNKHDPSKNLKTVMIDARNDEKLEVSEKQRRACNFVIHGAEEVGESSDQIRKEDEGYVKEILTKIGVEAVPISITRLGEKSEARSRPIKITMKTIGDQEKVMKNLKRLKGTEQKFGKISVKDDYTTNERDQIRRLNIQAKKLNDENPEKVFKIRGDSKNGWRVISFLKK